MNTPLGSAPSKGPRTPPPIPDHVLVQHIGSGSFGDVWLARNLMRTRRAVKIVWRANFRSEQDYLREREGVRRFEPLSRKHEGLVDVLQVGEVSEPACFYYVMELADDANAGGGESDESGYSPSTLEHELLLGRRLPANRCIDLGVELASALEFLHSHRLVHRDVKPSSIIRVDSVTKLADIGLVTDSEGAMTFVGTDGYIPPEGPGSPQADLYALGKVIYELAFGLDRKLFPDLPEGLAAEPDGARLLELNDVLVRACAPDRAKRYQTAGDLLADLRVLQSGQSVRRIRDLQRRVRWGAWALALVLLLGSAAMAVQFLRSKISRGQLALAQASLAMLGERTQGWRDKMLESIRSQGHYSREYRDLEIANLSGMDARTVLHWTNAAANSVAFDSGGGRIAVAGGRLGTQVVPAVASRPVTNGPLGAVAVAFDAEDRWVELRLGVGRNFEVYRGTRVGTPLELVWPGAEEAPPLRWDGEARLSADGSTVAVLWSGRLTVWDAVSGAIRIAEESTAVALAVGQDGSWIAVGGADGSVDLREVSGAGRIRLPPTGNTRINCIAMRRAVPTGLGPDRTAWMVAVGDQGGRVTVWNAARQTIGNILRGASFEIQALEFNADCTLLASASRYEIRFWDVAAAKSVFTLRIGDYFSCLRFSEDGRKLAATSLDAFAKGAVHVLDLEQGRGIATFRGFDSQAIRLAVSPDGRRLAALSQNRQLAVWDMKSARLERLREVPMGRFDGNAALTFSRDGRKLAFESGETAILMNMEVGSDETVVRLPEGLVNVLRFDVDGRVLSFRQENEGSPGKPRVVGRLRDLGSLQPTAPLLEIRRTNLWITDAGFAPDGRTLIVAGRVEAGAVAAIAFDTVKRIEKWRIPSPDPGTGTIVRFDSGGDLVSIGFSNQESKIYRVADGSLVGDSLPSSQFTARGGRIAVAMGQPAAKSNRGWAIFREGSWIFTLNVDAEPSGFPEFSGDGSIFAWPNRDGTISAANLDAVAKASNVKF